MFAAPSPAGKGRNPVRSRAVQHHDRRGNIAPAIGLVKAGFLRKIGANRQRRRAEGASNQMVYIPITDGEVQASLMHGRHHAFTVPVGLDDDRNATFSAEAGLSPRDGFPAWEYHFCVIGSFLHGEEAYLRRSELPPYVTRPGRKVILDGVCRATSALLNKVRPDRVFRVTCDAHLRPNAGLAKHERVSLVFASCGYVVESEGCTPSGMRRWEMRRT